MKGAPTAAISTGLGVSIMSCLTPGLEPESSRPICLDVEGFPLENHRYFAYPVGKQLSPTVRAFMEIEPAVHIPRPDRTRLT